MKKMQVIGKAVTLAFALALAFGMIAVAGAGMVQAADTPNLEDAPVIGTDFDWNGISADTEYRITDEVTIGVEQTVTIPETTTIHVLDGGVLTFEDCNLTLLGTVHAWPGSEVVVSSTGIELDGSVIAETGATITLKIDSAEGLTYRAIASETGDDVIIALSEGSVSFSETMIEGTEGWLFDIDGTAVFDMIDVAPINTFEALIQEGAELSIVDDLSEEGVITNHGTIAIADGVSISHSGWGFTNTGTIVNEGVVNITYDTVVNTGTITNNGKISTFEGADVDNDGVINGHGTWNAEISGDGTIAGGIFSEDVSSMLAEGFTSYGYSGLNVVVADTDSPALIIAGIPFASVEDALVLINATGDYATVDGDVLTLTANIPDTGDVAMTIPASSGLTIDLNGHDMAIGVVTLAGALNITDSVGEGTLTASGIVVTGGSVAGSGTIAATSGTVNLISIIGSGSVCGVTVDISDVTSNGGAVNIETGLTGTATIDGVTIVIDGADAVADRGIYVNQMPDTGSAVIRNVTFAFSGNDACPLNADVDGSTDLTIDRLKFVDCARTNKVLLNSIEDVTIGSEGNIRISGTTDIVLWDSSSTGKTFTVAGDLIVSGRMAVTFDGNLIVPETGSMTVNGSLEIHTDGTVEGTIHFGSDMTDSILLSDVVAGEDGLTLSLGSVVMSGSVASGSMTVNGTGRVDGNLDLGASTLTITSGSTFNVNRSSEVSGTSGLLVEGKMNVYGTVSAPVTNNGELYTIGSGAVTGAVTGDEPQEKEDEPLSIEFIPDMNWTIGEERSISIGVHPIDATITGLTGADWLTFTGNVISGAPTEAGTYTITLTVGVDNGNGMETVQDTFVITVAEAPVDDGQDDDGNGFDWRIIAIVILIVVIAILVLRNFIG